MATTDQSQPETARSDGRLRGRRLRPKWLPKAVFEGCLIVFSVFLALTLDSWRDELEVRERVAEARAYFAEEIAANRKELASPEIAPQHRRMEAVWRTFESIEAPTVSDRAAAWRQFSTGMHPFTARDAVWRSFNSSDLLEHMESREVFMLADIYRMQDQLKGRNEGLLAANTMPTADADTSPFIRSQAVVTRMTLADIIYLETKLLKRYDEALAVLSPKGGGIKSRD